MITQSLLFAFAMHEKTRDKNRMERNKDEQSENNRNEKGKKQKKDCTFWHELYEKPSVIPGCCCMTSLSRCQPVEMVDFQLAAALGLTPCPPQTPSLL